MAKRRRNRQLRGASCSTMGKVPRGVIGAVVGGVLGAAVVAGVFTALIPAAAAQAENDGTISPSFVALPVLLPVVGLVGTGLGAWVGARKPEC